jgi:excisionase family DNA binding protein
VSNDASVSPVMTVRDIADYLQVHPSTIYRLLRRRELPAFRLGSDWRFNREDIERWRLRQTAPRTE